MSEWIEIRHSEKSVADVVFIHGILGNEIDTWTNESGEFWPNWLADDFQNLNVYSYGYESSVSELQGAASMCLTELAINFGSRLQAEGVGTRPIYFICHSLGGIIVKSLLRRCREINGFKKIRSRTTSIVFISTPHIGSKLADTLMSIANVARKLSQPTRLIESLASNSELLIDLNYSFRNEAKDISCRVYIETQPTMGFDVVHAGPGDPGITHVTPIYLAEDHISICKPANRQADLYASVTEYFRGLITGENVQSPQLHGVSGRWEYELVFGRWRGFDLNEGDAISVLGYIDLWLPEDGNNGHGSLVGTLSASLKSSIWKEFRMNVDEPIYHDVRVVDEIVTAKLNDSGDLLIKTKSHSRQIMNTFNAHDMPPFVQVLPGPSMYDISLQRHSNEMTGKYTTTQALSVADMILRRMYN